MDNKILEKLAKVVRYYILLSTTTAGSGHPTSSLSATDLMTVLMFGGFFRFDFAYPDSPANDRLIFSKGHASPLLYSLYLAAGVITPKEILTLRDFHSSLEGHPTPRFKYNEAATGSLGQGLSVGVGMALALRARISNFEFRISNFPKVYVLLGDGEMAEGSVWEAVNLASYYRLDNLVAIVDVNRLGQSRETMYGWDTDSYSSKFRSFGWDTVVIDGHDYDQITEAFKTPAFARATAGKQNSSIRQAQDKKFISQNYKGRNRPFAIIARTVKGKGVSFMGNKDGWHGKPLPKDLLDKALNELGEVDLKLRGKVGKPNIQTRNPKPEILNKSKIRNPNYLIREMVATRKAYGKALERLGEGYPDIISLDAEVNNSTYSEIFRKKYPDRFFEMFIAEQNMVGAAVGLARYGYVPFVSTFAAFMTRAFDQIRMAALGEANVKFCGSHAGVSIGADGPSQMGLEDIAMFRAVHNSTVLYPFDAVSTEKLVGEMVKHKGISYMRTTRGETPVIYGNNEEFPIGGCKVHPLKTQNSELPTSRLLRQSGYEGRARLRGAGKSQNQRKKKRTVLIIAAGITLFEAFKAQQELEKEGIEATLIDCYSIKPIDEKTIKKYGMQIGRVVTVEDHWFEGGLGDAVLNIFATEPRVKIYKLAVSKMPRSGKPEELLDYEDISFTAIIKKVKEVLQ